MSFLTFITREFHALRSANRLAHRACKLAASLIAKVNASNASDALKAEAAAVQASINTFCTNIQAYEDQLNSGGG